MAAAREIKTYPTSCGSRVYDSAGSLDALGQGGDPLRRHSLHRTGAGRAAYAGANQRDQAGLPRRLPGTLRRRADRRIGRARLSATECAEPFGRLPDRAGCGRRRQCGPHRGRATAAIVSSAGVGTAGDQADARILWIGLPHLLQRHSPRRRPGDCLPGRARKLTLTAMPFGADGRAAKPVTAHVTGPSSRNRCHPLPRAGMAGRVQEGKRLCATPTPTSRGGTSAVSPGDAGIETPPATRRRITK